MSDCEPDWVRAARGDPMPDEPPARPAGTSLRRTTTWRAITTLPPIDTWQDPPPGPEEEH